MADNREDKEWLYGRLKDNGLNISYDDFDKTLNNEDDRKWYYDRASKMGLQVGSYDDFSKMFGTAPSQVEQPVNDSPETVAPAAPVEKERPELAGYITESLENINKELSKPRPAVQAPAGAAFIPSGAYGAAQRFGNIANQEQQDRYTSLVAAKNFLDDANKVVTEAGKKGKTNFVAGALRGVRDKGFDVDTWSMGITEASYYNLLRKAAEKEERGEQLTNEEQQLLDAAAVNMAANAYYASDLGRGYKAGAVTAESIPYMLQFAFNPVAGGRSAIAKGILNHGIKRFGLKGTAAKATSQVLGDVVTAAAITGTSGAGNVAEDAARRMVGDVQFNEDKDGNIVYAGRENEVDTGEAIARGFASVFFENQSEFVGNYFKPIKRVIGEYINKIPGVKRLSASKVGNIYRAIKDNPTYKEFTERTQWNGAFGEYAEEVYNNLASVAMGDMTPEELVDLDNNIDTFLGVGLMSAVFTGIGAAGFARDRYTLNRDIKRFEDSLPEEDREAWEEVKQAAREGEAEDVREFVKDVIRNDNLSTEEKREEIRYIHNLMKQAATENVAAEQTEEAIAAETEDIISHSDPATETYTEANRITTDPQTGEMVEVPGYIVGWIRDQPIWVPEGMPNTPENRVTLKPNEWNEASTQSMPTQEVVDAAADMAREQAASQAELESRYSPDIEAPSIGIRFTDGASQYQITQQNPGGGWLVQRTSTDEKGKEVQEVIPITDKEYYDLMQAQIDAQDQVEQQQLKAGEYSVNEEAVNNVGIDDFMNTGEYVRSTFEENPELMQTILRPNVRATADYLNGRLSDRDYLVALGFSSGENSWLNTVATSEEIAERARERGMVYLPFINQPASTEQSTSDNATAQENISAPMVATQPSAQTEPTHDPQPQQQAPTIPTDEQGEPVYHSVPVDVTVDALNKEGLEPQELDDFVQVRKKDAAKNLSNIEKKAPKMGSSIAKYKADNKAWEERLADAQAQVDYWGQVEAEIAARRSKPGDDTADVIRSMGEPMNAEEYTAMLLASGRLPIQMVDYKRETGYSGDETRSMFGLFAGKDKGGMTIEEAGERLVLSAQEDGYNFFDENDPNAGRNAILDVLSQAKTRGDFINFINRNREEQAAREQQAEYDAYDDWCQENVHMSAAEYEEWMSYVAENNPYEGVPVQEIERIFAEAEEAYQEYLNTISNGQQRATEINPRQDAVYESRGETETGQRSVSVLPETQPVLQGQVQGRTGGAETEPGTVDDGVRNQEGTVSDEASGYIGGQRYGISSKETVSERITPVGESDFGFVYDQFKGDPQGAIRQLIKMKDGEAIGALHHKDIGYIDLVWGKEGTKKSDGYGLAKLVKFHPEVVDNLQGILDDMDITKRTENRVQLENDNYKAAIRLIWNGNEKIWLLTAFKKKETSEPTNSSADVDSNLNGMSDDTATRQSSDVSENKDSENNSNNQTNNGFIAPERQENENLLDYAERVAKAKEVDDARKEVEKPQTDYSKVEEDAYTKTYQKLVDTLKGNIPNVDSIKKNIRNLKSSITKIENGMATGVANDEDFDRTQRKIATLSGQLRAWQQMQQDIETKLKETAAREEAKPVNPSGNRLVTDERYEELKKRMRELRGQMNMGIDPEILAIGTEMAVYHLEKGARKFADYAKAMIADLGDSIRPYLKSFYNGARNLPEVEEAGLADEMTPYEEVRTFDVANFDKETTDVMAAAETIEKEQEVEKQVETAKETIASQQEFKPGDRVISKKDGKKHTIMIVTHSGEQTSATTFSAPRVERYYFTDFTEATPDEVEAIEGKSENKAGTKKSGNKQEVSSQPVSGDLFANATEEQQVDESPVDAPLRRKFATTVKNDMLAALDSGTKPYRSIIDLRKRARETGMEVDNDGRTDILLQELVEDGLVGAAREVAARYGNESRESYDMICRLYEMQPTIAQRSSNRIAMQQYSTPLPMSWIADRFAMGRKKDGKVLEPTAGNGMLVFAIPAGQVHANELDETRLDNLRQQGFDQVTQQDALEPFEGGKQYDAVIANPPFGRREAVDYDGKLIPGLDPQITLNALASMKDNGRAAIIIGGNMEYGNNGGIKSMKPFFTYLYDHYNVKGVIDMDGKLYAKQGTTYPTRMILIDGRRSEEERAQTAVYPPVKDKAIRRAESFEDLYEIMNDLLNSKEKTNGTEVLRSREGQLTPVDNRPSGRTVGERNREQHPADDGRRPDRRGERGTDLDGNAPQSEVVLRGEHRTDSRNGETTDTAGGSERGVRRGSPEPDVRGLDGVGVPANRVGLNPEQHKRGLTEEKLAYRPHSNAFSLESVAPAAMVEAMDRVLTQIEAEHGNIDEFVRKELGYDTIEEAHQALAAEQMDSVAMAIYQMKNGQALIIGDQTGVGKGRQMAALIRWAVKRGEKPVFITQKADLFSDIYRDLVDIGSGDLVPFIFNSASGDSPGVIVDAEGNVVYKALSDKKQKAIFESGKLPDEYDFSILTYSQVNTGDQISQQEAEEAAKKRGKRRTKKSKASKEGKATPKATFLRSIAKDNYLFLDESHTAAGESNTGLYLQSILRNAKAATFASATFAKRPDTMPLYAIRTAMSEAKVEPDKMIGIIEKGGVTLQEIMSRELTNAGQMVRRERDMSDVRTDWKTIDDPATVKRARENYDRSIDAFNAIIKFQDDYVKPLIEEQDRELATYAESIGVKRGTNKLGIENTPFVSKTYNYTKQLMLALKADAIVNEVESEIKAGRHPVIALESTMESAIKGYSAGDVIDEPTFSASLFKGLDSVMQYTIKDENGKETHGYYSPRQLGEAGEQAYNELKEFIRKNTSDIFISPIDAIIEGLNRKGYKVGELTGRDLYVERDDKGRIVVRRRKDKDKKRMQREFNNGTLDVLILNKSASTGISLHASEKFADQRQRSMIIAQPLSDINDYMQMIGRIDRTGQVHRGYYINLGLPVPAENRFLMMLSTKLKSLNANTTTSQDSKSNEVEAPDLLNKYGSQVVVEYLRDNPEIYDKMGAPFKKSGEKGEQLQASELDEYKPQEDDARRITGYVALLSTKEQDEFYNDVVRRYNELIKYLDDTGSNDLKITVMPLRASTLEKRISSEGTDPNGSNPFARNAYVERVEMDVLRKPMKADDIRKTIDQLNKGGVQARLQEISSTIKEEYESKIAKEKERYNKDKAKAADDIAKQSEKINRQQKRTAEEKREVIAWFTAETNKKVDDKHNDNVARLSNNNNRLLNRLYMFEVGKSYFLPDNLSSTIFDFGSPAIFCGYKAKDSKITASTTLAVFATLDGRRRVEVKLSDSVALETINKMTIDNWDAVRSTTLDNWDSQIPTETRKQGYIMTGNILQAIADTQDEKGGYPGQLISYTDIDGNIHDGILMPDKWNTNMLKSSGAPLSSRMEQIKRYETVVSQDGKVSLTGSSWAKMYYLTVPKTKKDGAVYFENDVILRAAGGNFYPFRGKLRADILERDIEEVVRELTKLGVKVRETNDVVSNDDVRYREGEGTLTDDELSLANDPTSRMTGQSTRTRVERRTFAERERRRMAQSVRELAEKLHLDNVEIVTDVSTLEGRRARAKGFYSRSTGRITIVIPNQTSVFDAEQTLLHEAVAHYGLRQLFGEHFDTFLQNVYANADREVRDRIDALAERNGWDIGVATEEYLASLAENTNFENVNASWWNKIKEAFLRMLHKIGFENFSGVTLSDNELRYILWRSYENLREPGRYRSILGEAKDIAKQYELKVGNYTDSSQVAGNVAESEEENLLFRDTDDADDDSSTSDNTREAYNRAVSGNRFKAQEAYQDSMLALKRLQEVVEQHSGKPLKSYENAYMAENQMSSKSTRETEVYGQKFFKPMLEEVGRIMKEGSSYREVLDYLVAKHGLERNDVFAHRDAEQQADKQYEKLFDELEALHTMGGVTDAEYQQRKNKIEKARNEYYAKQLAKNLEKDYSGLTALAEGNDRKASEFKAFAQAFVSDFERIHDTEELWKRINAATKDTLRKSYESGMMSRNTYDKVSSQFSYYIPLRGWDKQTAEDVYEYMVSETSPVNSVLKSAKGRRSLADDPLATIGNMAESAIIQGNRNLMKQNFLNMVINHPSAVATLREAWYVKDPLSGDWVISFPDIQETDDADTIAQKVEEHEQRMRELAKDDEATRKREGLNIDYRASKRQEKEHAVVVKRNGKDYIVYVNGNPRAAQALNGMTNPNIGKSKTAEWFSRMNRGLAANLTNRNPAFVLSNLSRDLIFSVSAVRIKEGATYAKRFSKNIMRAMRIIARNLKGKGNINNADDALFQEFLNNGGETGYTVIHSVNEYKKTVSREINRITGKRDYFKAVRVSAQFFSTMNRWAEDVSRFTTYMTSRESGRSVVESINDAKEVTVNFNRRGAGNKTSGIFGISASLFRNCYLFFNAAVQSLANFTRLAKKNQKAFFTVLGGFTTAGFLMPVLNQLLISLTGDDDDDYYGNLPDWVRRNNLCLYIPGTKGKFLTIPLPIELRAFYGLGEMAYQYTIGKEFADPAEIVFKTVNQITELLPLNPLGNNGNIVTTFAPDLIAPFIEINENEDFTGKPISKRTPFNENNPEWTKAYKSTLEVLVKWSEIMNELTGGNKYKKGTADQPHISNFYFNNPAQVEHLLESYFGGFGRFINQAAKTLVGLGESAIDGEWSESLQWYSTPVLNRFVNDASDDRSSFGKINQRYYKLYDIYEEVGKNLRGYSNEVSSGNLEYLDWMEDLLKSDDFRIYLLFKNGNKDVTRIQKLEKQLPESSGREKKEIQETVVQLKRKIVEEAEKIAE